MPWNDNNNPGPWGSPPSPGGKGSNDDGPRRPGGPGPRRPNTPPDLEEFQQRVKDQVRDLFGGGAGGSGGTGGEMSPRKWLPLAGGVLAALYIVSGVIIVGPKEEAVVTTFGAWTRSYGPGIGYHLPIVERRFKVPVTSLQKTDVGGVPGATIPQESLMLTGDENIVDMTFTVNWRVSSPGRFLFNIPDPQEATVKAVAESAMREVVGRNALTPIISTQRARVQVEVAQLMQRMLDLYGAGIIIDSVQIRDAQPPKEVVAAFQDVATAGQNAEATINAARGQASQIRQQALGYKAQVVSEASGEAARFNQIYEQYRLAPGVTRDRLYIETMERVLRRSNKVIIDGKGVTAPIVLSPDVFRPRAPAGTPAAVTPAPGAAQ
jgi:membrane protease subunit HflK